jgi:hypothetical protein
MQNLIQSKTKLETSILSKLNVNEQKLVTLNHLGNVRFGEMTNEQKQGLAKCLVKLCYFVGIKEPLSIDNLKMLVFYLANQHPTFTQDELEQAFFMTSSGEFGELEHYQSFSPMYVSKIINLYSSRRSEAITKYRKELNDKMMEDERIEKQKNYNAIDGCIEAICLQYDSFLKYNELKVSEDAYGLEEMKGKIAIELGQRLGLFQDFNEKEENTIDFFSRIFQPLSKYEAEKVKRIIGKWVKEQVCELKR